jgi:hypothetical protein
MTIEKSKPKMQKVETSPVWTKDLIVQSGKKVYNAKGDIVDERPDNSGRKVVLDASSLPPKLLKKVKRGKQISLVVTPERIETNKEEIRIFANPKDVKLINTKPIVDLKSLGELESSTESEAKGFMKLPSGNSLYVGNRTIGPLVRERPGESLRERAMKRTKGFGVEELSPGVQVEEEAKEIRQMIKEGYTNSEILERIQSEEFKKILKERVRKRIS